ncbi:vacuolar import and degradation protein 30-like [Cynara cardunculus var. scolymus]|uniref:vacuolar import and degradation protein 30-like n=1 Tax=Cynara cardunculus var. scolymus TaxID=59895 RepID=UPI000D628B49|nr:vacuolar import and degradation protein 30-like [Cynara cardunculus var. scolymus]
MQVDIQANAETVNALSSKADEANSHLAKYMELMQQILVALQQPISTAKSSFTVDDPRDDDLPVTSAANAGDLDDDDDDEDDDKEDGEYPDLPNAGKHLDDDDDKDDDDNGFTNQYQRPAGATKGVTLKDSTSQGEQREKEATQEKHQNTKSKDKGVAEEGNLRSALHSSTDTSCSSSFVDAQVEKLKHQDKEMAEVRRKQMEEMREMVMKFTNSQFPPGDLWFDKVVGRSVTNN